MWTFQFHLNKDMVWKGWKICRAVFIVWPDSNVKKAGVTEFLFEIFLSSKLFYILKIVAGGCHHLGYKILFRFDKFPKVLNSGYKLYKITEPNFMGKSCFQFRMKFVLFRICLWIFWCVWNNVDILKHQHDHW